MRTQVARGHDDHSGLGALSYAVKSVKTNFASIYLFIFYFFFILLHASFCSALLTQESWYT